MRTLDNDVYGTIYFSSDSQTECLSELLEYAIANPHMLIEAVSVNFMPDEDKDVHSIMATVVDTEAARENMIKALSLDWDN